MIKKALSFLLVMLTATLSIAQSHAEKYIDKVIAQIEKAPGIEANFKIESLNRKGILMEGTIKIEGKKFYIETADLITWYDGKTMWSYIPGVEEVNITEPTAQEIAEINPMLILGSYIDSFRIKEQPSKKREERIFTLTPTKRNLRFNEITLTIATANMAPVLFQVIDRNNNTTNVTIEQFDKDITHPQSTFTFVHRNYPRATIVDLR